MSLTPETAAFLVEQLEREAEAMSGRGSTPDLGDLEIPED